MPLSVARRGAALSRPPCAAARAGGAALVALALVVGSAVAVLTHTSRAEATSCSPCTYTVSPGGAGSHNLGYVMQHLVQAHDTVVLTDGVYRVANLQVTAPNVTIIAQHVAPAGAQPQVWL